MKDWEDAEERVAALIKGKRTPGSGNHYIKGDVRAPGKLVEVKQTAAQSFTIKSVWFDELIKESKKLEVAFVVFFELAGHVYYLDSFNGPDEEWKSKKISSDNLPQTIYYKKSVWNLDTIQTLRDW
jgi:hypothetical protein